MSHGAYSLVLMVAAVACADAAPQMRVILETPRPGTSAYPLDLIDQLTFTIARQGAPDRTTAVTPGQPITLTELPFGEPLIAHLSGTLGSGEVAYGRTCDFTVFANADMEPPERRLFFSRIVKMAQYRELINPDPQSGIALPSGAALFVGGGSTMDSVERLDPSSGALETIAAVIPRQGSVLVSFDEDPAQIVRDGKALLVGGVAQDNAVAKAELLNLDELPAFRVAEWPGPRLRDHAATALIGGAILVAGGAVQMADGQPFTVTDIAHLFRVTASGELTDTQLSSPMISARAGHTLTRLRDDIGDDVLIIGGLAQNGSAVAEAEVYRPQSQSFEALVGASMLIERFGHTAIRMPDSSVFIVGGFTPTVNGPVAVQKMELYDVVRKEFADAGQLDPGAGVSELSVTPLPDGGVLLAGGRNVDGVPVAKVFIARLDPISRQVGLVGTAPLSVARAGHSAVLLCDGTILIAGGAATPSPTERYNPVPEGRR